MNCSEMYLLKKNQLRNFQSSDCLFSLEIEESEDNYILERSFIEIAESQKHNDAVDQHKSILTK